MNAVEIEQAVSELALKQFDPVEFPYAFLAAFGAKENSIKQLRSGDSNKSDIGGVLQRKNIHIGVTETGKTHERLKEIRSSLATTKWKVEFILATDGETLEAEALGSGEAIVCKYEDFPDHFGFFLPLAGISPVKQIRDNAFDIRATSRLNKLYVELLKDNPDWAAADKRHEMNHFMARLIFCFFAEDTYIFSSKRLFTTTVDQMSARDSSNTHEVISELFRSMDTPIDERESANIPRWADAFPYVNGGLFAGSVEVPRFSKISRSYLMNIGTLDWTKINPDIFGSMIQAITEDEERGALGMHYTSVPNILKVLDPLFLDDLREKLEDAGDNPRTLLNLRKRIARIRVFDPACGSGNFLVIAYKKLREIEFIINERRGESYRKSDIPLTNFSGIELRDFPAEIARLALIIAEYQCDLEYRGQREALREFLPLKKENWIICGNALRLDWLSICPPTGTGIKVVRDDLFSTPLEQTEIEFENEGGETYICGNPPYLGSKWQSSDQKLDLESAWSRHPSLARNSDYVTGWIARFLDYAEQAKDTVASFVSTNSICQGQLASELWPVVYQRDFEIRFAHTSFKWQNLASKNAVVTVVILGLAPSSAKTKKLFQGDQVKSCSAIGPYLVPDSLAFVQKSKISISDLAEMLFGNMPRDGGHLILSREQYESVSSLDPIAKKYLRRLIGSAELINGLYRYCLWIAESKYKESLHSKFVSERLKNVEKCRIKSKAQSTRDYAQKPYRFVQVAGEAVNHSIVIPRVSSELRNYLPVDYLDADCIVSDSAFSLYDAPLWNMSLIASRIHLVWIATVCGKLKTDFRYSNTLGWNTFPVPTLTEKNKADLTRCAEDILLAREAHFPTTIADMYEPDSMPVNLREAHDRNDEVLERIYIGRRFKNDTERLEKLFELYTKMVATTAPVKKTRSKVKA